MLDLEHLSRAESRALRE